MVNLPSPTLRQPPPLPGHHQGSGGSITSRGEELRSEIAGDNCVSGKHRTRPYYLRKSNKLRPTNIESLPDDILFKILLNLSAQDNYNSARRVCSKWYHMIRSHYFMHSHLEQSPTGLLIQSDTGIAARTSPIFVSMSHGRIKICKFTYKSRDLIWSSCNGLLLRRGCKNQTLYVSNPATKQYYSLPPCHMELLCNYCSGLAYAAASMEYKVVRAYKNSFEDVNATHCAILTVGVDESWRQVQIEHLSVTAKGLILCGPMLVTEGFVHFARSHTDFLVTLNLETETISQIPIPQNCRERLTIYYFSTGRCLSIVSLCDKFCWKVWEMKPDPLEWKRLPDIDLGAQECMLKRLSSIRPVGWIKYKEVMLFRVTLSSRICISYNVCTQEIESFEIDSDTHEHRYVVHTNSVVWFGGC